jgi:hypothetical protein
MLFPAQAARRHDRPASCLRHFTWKKKSLFRLAAGKVRVPGSIEQSAQTLAQSRKTFLDRAPYCSIVDGGVAMDQNVAERDGMRKVRYLAGQTRRCLFQLTERFADDLELPLDCRAQHTVGEIIVQFRPVTNSAIASALSLASQRYARGSRSIYRLDRPLNARADKRIADAAIGHEINRPAEGSRKRVAQCQEFAQRHAIRPFERYNEIDIGSSRIEISIAARRTENPESPNPEAPAQRGDFRAALGD